MITWWEVITDTVGETQEPQGETLIEARVDHREGESVKAFIDRGIDECYSYVDPNGYSCLKNIPHPKNSGRRANLRPVYCASFSVDEHKSVPNLFQVKLQWAVPDRIPGVDLERRPPERGQWSETRQSLFDPNTKRLHQTTAGELIRGIEVVCQYPSLLYQLRMEQLPSWFEEAQAGPINEDYVRLDGKTYEPYTLNAKRCTATVLRGDQPGEFYRDIEVEVAVNPDGWDKMNPNIGYYEQRMTARTWKPETNENGDEYYVLGKQDIDVYPYIANQSDVDRFMQAAREGRAINLNRTNSGGAPPVKILTSFERIMTVINPSGNQEAKEVDKPVPLDRNGVAYRVWTPGSEYTTGSAARPYPLPLRTQIDPSELIMLRPRPMKTARMSQWGL